MVVVGFSYLESNNNQTWWTFEHILLQNKPYEEWSVIILLILLILLHPHGEDTILFLSRILAVLLATTQPSYLPNPSYYWNDGWIVNGWLGNGNAGHILLVVDWCSHLWIWLCLDRAFFLWTKSTGNLSISPLVLAGGCCDVVANYH